MKGGDLTDPVVNEYCAMLIRQYTDRLNRVNATCWEIKEVIEFLLKDDEEACFSDYARKFIDRMEADGHERNAKNYRLAVNHLERFMGTTRLLFSNLSSSAINLWIVFYLAKGHVLDAKRPPFAMRKTAFYKDTVQRV